MLISSSFLDSSLQRWKNFTIWDGFEGSLIRKDREEQNDPAMDAFFGNLGNAYRDPALMPTQYSENPDPRRYPLLG